MAWYTIKNDKNDVEVDKELKMKKYRRMDSVKLGPIDSTTITVGFVAFRNLYVLMNNLYYQLSRTSTEVQNKHLR